MSHSWEEAQVEELAFWDTPGAEFGEQLKQLTYARFLGIDFYHDGSSPYVIDKTNKAILDIGGGPVSLLLKTIASRKVVVDPCKYPIWVYDRYEYNDVTTLQISGERFNSRYSMGSVFDEVWMYNVLQHTESPEKIFKNIYNSLRKGGKFRFLDWVDTPTNVAHPVSLTKDQIITMLDKAGFKECSVDTEILNENGAVGKVAYGIFKK